jgi:ferredoxin--NADP+ reductase
MFDVIAREMIAPNLHLLTVAAPDIAEQIQPGNFVIVRSDDEAERIPLSVADWDREAGTVTTIFMVVGASTDRMSRLKAGDTVPTVVGPLGKPTAVENYGTAACVGGCYGIGSIFPLVRALREKGNRVVTIIEARSNFLLYWQDRLREFSDILFVITRDGSSGAKGHVSRSLEILQKPENKPGQVYVNGCTYLLAKTSRELDPLHVPIMVSLNPIMIDGTGMCGVCRVTVDGRVKFACVDGPDFDGRLVDWDELLKRRKQYMNEEAFLVHDSGCGGVRQ